MEKTEYVSVEVVARAVKRGDRTEKLHFFTVAVLTKEDPRASETPWEELLKQARQVLATECKSVRKAALKFRHWETDGVFKSCNLFDPRNREYPLEAQQ